MARPVAAGLLIVVFVVFTSSRIPHSDSVFAEAPESLSELREGTGSAARSGRAAAHLDNEVEPPTGTCTATWTGIGGKVTPDMWWNLATGSPHADTYALSADCLYDTAAPANTPLVWPPEMEAWVDGVRTLVADFKPSTGELRLFTNANAGAAVRIDFYFDATRVPRPTPVPAAGPTALILLGGLFAGVLSWRLADTWYAAGRHARYLSDGRRPSRHR